MQRNENYERKKLLKNKRLEGYIQKSQYLKKKQKRKERIITRKAKPKY